MSWTRLQDEVWVWGTVIKKATVLTLAGEMRVDGEQTEKTAASECQLKPDEESEG